MRAEQECDAAAADANRNGSLYTQVLRERECAWTERDAARAVHAEALAVLREKGAQHGMTIYQQIKAAFDALNARQEVEWRRRTRRPGIEGCARDDDGREHAAKARLPREREEAARMTVWKDSQGREVLHVTRSRVEVLGHSGDVEHVALRIAAQKFGGAVSITGSAEFRERLARLATREGIRAADPDLARIVEDERQRMMQPKRPPRSDPTVAWLAAWWNPKSQGARLAALDAAEEVGCARTLTGAWHAMRDAAEHKAGADPAVRERLERGEGQSCSQNSEPEPEQDDQQELGR